jgi:hypothetical protein
VHDKTVPRNTVRSANAGFCFVFGFGNSAHVLASSTAADVVEPGNLGTSAALINGFMLILGGIVISLPGLRIGFGIEVGPRRAPSRWRSSRLVH